MADKKIKDIFHFEREEMSRTVKWVFGLPFAFTLYIVVSLFIPNFGTGFFASNAYNILIQAALLLAFVFVIRKFLKVERGHIFSDCGTFSFRKFLVGFCLMFVCEMALCFIEMAIKPQDYSFTLTGNPVPYWLVTLILIIIAASTEEVIFRFYIGHFVSDTYQTSKKSVIICTLVSSVLFALAHLANPEIKVAMFISLAFYFILGCGLMYCTLKTGGIEYALGVHIANNLIAGWFFSYPDSVLVSYTVFTKNTVLDYFTVIEVVISTLVFCLGANKLTCSKN